MWFLASPFRVPAGSDWEHLPALAFFRNGKEIRSVLYKDLVKAVPKAPPLAKVEWLNDIGFNGQTVRIVTNDGGDYLFDRARGDRKVDEPGERNLASQISSLPPTPAQQTQLAFVYGAALSEQAAGMKLTKASGDQGVFTLEYRDWDRDSFQPVTAT